jgi:hypothetical protein
MIKHFFCHPGRREGSHLVKNPRFFTMLRMTDSNLQAFYNSRLIPTGGYLPPVASVSGEQVLKPMNFSLYKQAYYVKLFIPIFLYNDLCPEEKTNISGAPGKEEISF